MSEETEAEKPGAELSPTPLAERHAPIQASVRRFEFLMDALRSMQDQLDPRLAELTSNHLSARLSGAIEGIDEERSAKFFNYVSEVFEAAESVSPDEVSISFEIPRLEEILEDRHLANEAVRSLTSLPQFHNPASIFRNSLLTQAIGAFELLITNIVTRRYVETPRLLNDDEAVFSLNDLREFEDVIDATDYLIGKRVLNEMQGGGIAGWSKWFEKEVGSSLEEMVPDYPCLCEAVQRRHIILHNGGIVSRRYLDMLPDSCDAPEIGKRLAVDEDYLAKVNVQLDSLGTIASTWAQKKWKLEPEDTLAGHHLQRSYELMRQGQWDSALRIAEAGLLLKASNERINSITANRLTALAQVDGIDEAAKQALKWDTSGLQEVYQVIQQLLIGNVEGVLAALPDLVEREVVSKGELVAWPVFVELRKKPEFERAIEEIDQK